jgi:hypothetical protein
MKSILPIIFIVLALTGAITYTLAKRTLPVKPINNMGIPANELEGNSTATPTPTGTKKVSFGSLVLTPTPSKSATPTVFLPEITENTTTKGGQTNSTSKTSTTVKTTTCTSVYGSAETCTEHITVDTGVENAFFFNLAGLAYIGGLASFVKAKSLKR